MSETLDRGLKRFGLVIDVSLYTINIQKNLPLYTINCLLSNEVSSQIVALFGSLFVPVRNSNLAVSQTRNVLGCAVVVHKVLVLRADQLYFFELYESMP